MRYLRLLALQLRVSLQLSLQYRWDFFLEGLLAVFGAAVALVPVWVAFDARPQIGSDPPWRFEESLVVLGWFTLLKGVLEGAVNPSLVSVVEHIRKGTLDFVLLKPADAQFLVSTQRFAPWRAVNVLAGVLVLGYAFTTLGRLPAPLDVALSALMLVLAILVLYSLWILVVSAAFFVGRIDNLRFLFLAVFDAARWPSTVYRGALSIVFTYVIPLALMTSYPAGALLGRLPGATVVGAWVGGLTFVLAARRVWLLSIRRYTSASS